VKHSKKSELANFRDKLICFYTALENPITSKILVFFFCAIVYIFFAIIKYHHPGLFQYQLDDPHHILTTISIVYGIVGAFVAIMVPLHYSLSFNIIGEIEDIRSKKNDINLIEEERKLKNYCHTAEGLIYSFALFGALVLLEEAFVIALILYINIPSLIKKAAIMGYFYVLILGMSHNLRLSKEWELNIKFAKKEYRKYLGIFSLSLVFSCIWGSLLWMSNCHNLNAIIALILVIGYYILWIFLRHLFAPLSTLKKLLLPRVDL